MGMYKYIRKAWNKPKANSELYRQRLIEWRRQPVSVRIERPTRLDKARSLGYKAKQGIIIIRQRVGRGKRQRQKFSAGRRPKAMRRKKVVHKNYQQIAEERSGKKHLNCEVLNSYMVAEDGKFFWYEVILLDREHPQIMSDKNLGWAAFSKGRAGRGKTSAGRKSRGLRKKGIGSEKTRPSRRANLRRG